MGGFRGVGVSLVKAAIGGDRVAIERVVEAKMPVIRCSLSRRWPRWALWAINERDDAENWNSCL